MPDQPQSAPVRKIVRLTSKQGQATRLKEALQTLEAETIKEAGCIEFTFYQAISEESAFILFEDFTDAEAFSAHMEMPYTKVFFSGCTGRAGQWDGCSNPRVKVIILQNSSQRNYKCIFISKKEK